MCVGVGVGVGVCVGVCVCVYTQYATRELHAWEKITNIMKEVYDINKDISSATRIAVLQACLRSGISYMTQPSGAATCIRGRADAGGGRQVIRPETCKTTSKFQLS